MKLTYEVLQDFINRQRQKRKLKETPNTDNFPQTRSVSFIGSGSSSDGDKRSLHKNSINNINTTVHNELNYHLHMNNIINGHPQEGEHS